MQNFTEYFETVLGVKQLLITPNTPGFLGSEAGPHHLSITPGQLCIFVEDYGRYTPAEIELLQKVLAAVGLQPDGYVITDNREHIQKSHLVFLDAQTQATDQKPEQLDHEFPSPRLMLRDASFKKHCWQKLQAWMKSSSIMNTSDLTNSNKTNV